MPIFEHSKPSPSKIEKWILSPSPYCKVLKLRLVGMAGGWLLFGERCRHTFSWGKEAKVLGIEKAVLEMHIKVVAENKKIGFKKHNFTSYHQVKTLIIKRLKLSAAKRSGLLQDAHILIWSGLNSPWCSQQSWNWGCRFEGCTSGSLGALSPIEVPVSSYWCSPL